MSLLVGQYRAAAQEGLIDVDLEVPVGGEDVTWHRELSWQQDDSLASPGGEFVPSQNPVFERVGVGNAYTEDNLDWLDSVRVGYDGGFVIASQRDLNLNASNYPFRMQINGWAQLRYTVTDIESPNTDLNQFQLKHAAAHLLRQCVRFRHLLLRATGRA